MKKGINIAKVLAGDIKDMELPKGEGQERALTLKMAPRSRKRELIARGAKEIRCIHCHQIKPLAGAEESAGEWVCEDCCCDGAI